MSLSYLIDGYNVINHIRLPHLYKNKENPRKALLEFISSKRLCGSNKNTVTVVFDGFPKAEACGELECFGINVVFSRKESADTIIKRMLEKVAQPKNTIVVSDDREIRFFAGDAGAWAQGVEDFVGLEGKSSHRERTKKCRDDSSEPQLNYSDICRINKELRKRWLGE